MRRIVFRLGLLTMSMFTLVIGVGPLGAMAAGQWTAVNTLTPRWNYAVATVGSKVLIAGGDRFDGDKHDIVVSDQVDIYDTSTGAWSSAKLAEPQTNILTATAGDWVVLIGAQRAFTTRQLVTVYDSATGWWSATEMPDSFSRPGVAAIGEQVIVAGSDASGKAGFADVYDLVTDTWTSTSLPNRPTHPTMLVVGDSVIVANDVTFPWDVVNVYDSVARTWSSARLSQARSLVGIAVAGDRAYIAGGSTNGPMSDVVDIYDATTRSWAVAHLSEARELPLGVVSNGKLLFAGGSQGSASQYAPSTAVDILDLASGEWSAARLSVGRYAFGARMPQVATPGTHVLFSGSVTDDPSKLGMVDIFDTVTGAWSTARLSDSRENLRAVTVGTQALLAGGSYRSEMDRSARANSDTVDIYDEPTGTWSAAHLSLAREPRLVAVIGSRALFVGGVLGCQGCAEPHLDPIVDLYAAP